MNHYYTNNETLAHHFETIPLSFAGQDLQFQTDKGVFSKGAIDFGSKTLLESFAETQPKGTLLEVGCGYGPIALSLAKVFPLQCDLVDINLRALDLAKHNALKNQVQNKVHIYESNIYANVQGSFDYILSNPPIRAGKKVVHAILEEAKQHLHIGGELWIVIQKKQGAPSAEKKMLEIFHNVEVVRRNKGYYILKSIREAD